MLTASCCDTFVTSFRGNISLYSRANALEETKWLKNGAEPQSKGFWKERMRKLQMYNISRHNVNTTWKKYVEQFWIYMEMYHSIGYERSFVDERDLSHMV